MIMGLLRSPPLNSRPAVSPLRQADFRMLLAGITALFFGYTLLLPVVPLWVIANRGGEFVAGAATGVFMAGTVTAQLTVPRLVRAAGYRTVIVIGAVLLGTPAAALVFATDWQLILGISLLRGVGFGLVTVCGSALIAELLPRAGLARGSGLYGVAVGIPQLVGLAAGTLLAQNWGFAPVFLMATALPLLGIVPLAFLPNIIAREAGSSRWLSTLGANWRPWAVMLCGSIAFGSVVTFLPVALSDTPVVASVALLAATAAALLSRWAAGSYGDRLNGAARMLPGALAVCVLGMAGLAVATAAHTALWAVLVVAVFGLGFGVVQNDSLVAMLADSPAEQASVGWNVAFDAGTGIGSTVVGAVVTGFSYPVAFGVLAGLAVILLPVARGAARAGT